MMMLFTLAQLTQEEVFKAISQHVSEPTQFSPRVVGLVLMVVSAVLFLIWWSNRSKLPRKPKQVNHSRKLIRQISKEVGLAKAEMKQLKLLADVHRRSTGQPVENPLTLLLCPSLLGKAIEAAGASVDRQVVARMARRLLSK